jgi:hypothetical protein
MPTCDATWATPQWRPHFHAVGRSPRSRCGTSRSGFSRARGGVAQADRSEIGPHGRSTRLNPRARAGTTGPTASRPSLHASPNDRSRPALPQPARQPSLLPTAGPPGFARPAGWLASWRQPNGAPQTGISPKGQATELTAPLPRPRAAPHASARRASHRRSPGATRRSCERETGFERCWAPMLR